MVSAPDGVPGSGPRTQCALARCCERGVVTKRERSRSMSCHCSHLRRYIVNARINYFGNALAGKVMKHLNSAGAAVHAAIPVTTQELVKIRASQINGCGFCTDMHTKDAAA